MPTKTVTATYPDGRILTWTDGAVDGDPLLLRALAPMAKTAGTGQAMPEAAPVDLADYESNPAAFVALGRLIHPGGAPRYDFAGPIVLATPPPEDAN